MLIFSQDLPTIELYKQKLINQTTDQLNQLVGEIDFMEEMFNTKLENMNKYVDKYIT